MKQEELEAGKFYWVELVDGTIEPAEYDDGSDFYLIGGDGYFGIGGLITRVICECVKFEEKG